MRRAARTDRNQSDIIRALEFSGAAVTDLSAVGKGCTDLLASYRGRWFVLEVKNPAQRPSDRKLTEAQVRWHARQNAPVHTVLTADDALKAIGAVADLPPRWVEDTVS